MKGVCICKLRRCLVPRSPSPNLTCGSPRRCRRAAAWFLQKLRQPQRKSPQQVPRKVSPPMLRRSRTWRGRPRQGHQTSPKGAIWHIFSRRMQTCALRKWTIYSTSVKRSAGRSKADLTWPLLPHLMGSAPELCDVDVSPCIDAFVVRPTNWHPSKSNSGYVVLPPF